MDDKTRQVVFETNGKTYGELYWSLIEERRASPPPEGLGASVHHVVPKSICPILKRSNENLVRLTDREHLVAHFLLWQHYKRETSERGWEAKMCTAFWQMVKTIEWRGVAELEWLSERYEEARADFSKTMSGESNPMKRPEVREKVSEAKKGDNNPMKRPEVREKQLVMIREKLSKKVVQCSPDGTFITEYSSMTEAAHKTNSRESRISMCCSGRQKTHNGFVWRLAAEPQAEEPPADEPR